MASKIVTRKQTTAGAVEAAAATHAPEVGTVLNERLAAFSPDGNTPVDFILLQNLLAHTLERDRVAMEAADSAHIEELRDDIGPRERRDAAVQSLHDRVVRVRSTVETVFGPGASLKLFAIKGATSRNPEVLRRQAERMLDRLRDEEKPLPEPEVTWLAVDPVAWAGEIEPAHTELVAALRDVYADRRRAEITFRLKREALGVYNRTYAAVTSILSGLYRLAGLDAYEERLRPPVPQGGAVEEELLEDEAPPETGEGEASEPAPPLEFPRPGDASAEGETAGDTAAGEGANRSIA